MSLSPVRSETAASHQVVAVGLSFPTGIAFDPAGAFYVCESGLPWGGAPPGGRIWKYPASGPRRLLAEGLRHPVNGITWHADSLFVSEGGHPGRISRIFPNGRRDTVLDNLPGPGNYHTNMVVFGPDGRLYFSQGAMSNMGVVGLDAYDLGWLGRLPHQHDLPGLDIELTGFNAVSADPTAEAREALAVTGAFVPFGTATRPGQRIAAKLPCTAAVMRCNPDGSQLQLVAWGLRNAYALGFLPDGRLLAIDQGADDRGSRPVGSAPDVLYHVRQGAWYGWPDFIAAEPASSPRFRPERGPQPSFVLANHSRLPPPEPALLHFPPHCGAVKFDVAPADHPLWAGDLIVAMFGDEVPMTAPRGPKTGRHLARVDTRRWSLRSIDSPPLQRPIDVRFGPHDGSLYIVDFGFFEMNGPQGLSATPENGRVIRIRT